MSFGTLYIIATPIGNLSDITFRAIDTLKKVDYIISEDARNTAKLLNHYKIDKKQVIYRDENKKKAIPKIVSLLELGCDMALVTDSGTPLISDPGFKLVSELVKKGIKVEPVPGANAAIAALTVSALPTDKFLFLGFLPRKESQAKNTLKQYKNLDATIILYESPQRVLKTLNKIDEVLGNRQVCVAKELTKLHEKVFYGTVKELFVKIPKKNLKGEFVILIAKEGF